MIAPLAAALVVTVLVVATDAVADPCLAIPERGPKPDWIRPGVSFTGPVVHVIDGDGLCVGVGANPRDPSMWVEVRLADYYAPELNKPGGPAAKRALEDIAMSKTATCVAQRASNGQRFSWDRVVSSCTIDGVNIGDAMRRRGVVEGGRGR